MKRKVSDSKFKEKKTFFDYLTQKTQKEKKASQKVFGIIIENNLISIQIQLEIIFLNSNFAFIFFKKEEEEIKK